MVNIILLFVAFVAGMTCVADQHSDDKSLSRTACGLLLATCFYFASLASWAEGWHAFLRPLLWERMESHALSIFLAMFAGVAIALLLRSRFQRS